VPSGSRHPASTRRRPPSEPP